MGGTADEGKYGLEVGLELAGNLGEDESDTPTELEQQDEIEEPIEPEPVIETVPEPLLLPPVPEVPPVAIPLERAEPVAVEPIQPILAVKTPIDRGDQLQLAATRFGGGEGNRVGGGGERGIRLRYLDVLAAHIFRYKRYPLEARRQGIEGITTLRIIVNRDGSLQRAAIARGSGYPILDEAALQMIRDAEPLPRFTQDMDRDSLRLSLPTSFVLRKRDL